MITLSEVYKQFENKSAVNDVSFHIPKGESVGMIGTNGSGKTTILKLLTGVLKPTSGYIRIGGVDPLWERKNLTKKMGVLFANHTRLLEELPIIDSFLLTKTMYKIKEEDYKERFKVITQLLHLEEELYQKVKQLSFGERIRADIACILIQQPELIILDEALLGLDEAIKEEIIHYLIKLQKEEETTILITSHNLADVEKLCNRIIVLDEGKVIYYGDMKGMKSDYFPNMSLSFEITNKLPDMQDLPIEKYSLNNKKVTITYNSNLIRSGEIVQNILSQCDVEEIKMHEPRMEEILLNMYKKNQEGKQ